MGRPKWSKRYATDYIIENAYFADSRRDADMSNAGMANNASTPASTDDGEFITIDDTEELPLVIFVERRTIENGRR